MNAGADFETHDYATRSVLSSFAVIFWKTKSDSNILPLFRLTASFG